MIEVDIKEEGELVRLWSFVDWLLWECHLGPFSHLIGTNVR